MDPTASLASFARAVALFKDAVLLTTAQRDARGVRPIVFVNRAFTEMTGFTAEDALGKLPDITVGPETDVKALESIQTARSALLPVRVELLKYRKDGTTFWAELDVIPVFDDGGCTHFLGVMRDITSRREQHARLFEAERLASLGTLAAGIAHEINNPLAYVLMNLQFLEEELPAISAHVAEAARSRWAEVVSAVAEMKQGAGRVAQIVSDIRGFSQLERAPNGICELPAVVDQALRVVRVGLPARAIVTRRYDDVPPVRGDPGRLSQVFLNVLLNAVDAIPSDETERRRVDVRLRRLDDEVVVEISDEGAGIAPDVLPRIFDPFFTTKPPGKGSGLGLSVAHAIVRGIGGRMNVESTLGVGTLVRVVLPADIRRDSLVAPPAPRASAPAPSGGSLRILIIDDDALVARALRRALGQGNDVVVCDGGRAALELLEQTRDFDLIFSDLTMPGVGGAELFRRVEHRWPGLERKIVILSGGACTEDGRRLLARTDVRRLDKPLDRVALGALLTTVRSTRAERE